MPRTRTKTKAEAVQDFRVKRRRELIELAGGKCVRCGYSRCDDALVFHHRDPSTKAFALSKAGVQVTMRKCLDEMAKCDLLCANCHAEVHAAERKAEDSNPKV